MNWTNVKDTLPDPFEVVWIYWRNREVLLGCRVYEDDPNGKKYGSSEGWYSFEDEKCRWNHYWMSVKDSGLDKPDPPEINND